MFSEAAKRRSVCRRRLDVVGSRPRGVGAARDRRRRRSRSRNPPPPVGASRGSCGEQITCTLGSAASRPQSSSTTSISDHSSNACEKPECGFSVGVFVAHTRHRHEDRHDEFVEALRGFRSDEVGMHLSERRSSAARLGPPTRPRPRLHRQGHRGSATLPTSGGRPELDRDLFVQPTVFGNINNASTIGRDEIFNHSPPSSPRPTNGHVRIANDSILDLDRRVCSTTASTRRRVKLSRSSGRGPSASDTFRTNFGMAFGGFKRWASVGGWQGRAHALLGDDHDPRRPAGRVPGSDVHAE